MSSAETITAVATRAQTLKAAWKPATAALIAVATLAGLLHLLPVLHGAATTPPDWRFSGNVTISPDYMQYRTWARQTQEMGPIVDNRFTPEPNPPHLLVLFYYLVGQLSRWTRLSPEFVYAYLGAPLAFILTVLVFVTVRQFSFATPSHAWWVTGILLFGGGLGAHLKGLEGIAAVRESPLLQRVLIEPLWNQNVFENRRGFYLINTVFDTHFLAIWIVTLGAVLSLYLTLRKYSPWRLLATSALFGFATLFHVYEGVTLVAIVGGIAAWCWLKDQHRRAALLALFSCVTAVTICTLALAALYHRSGLPVSPWRVPPILIATLLIAHPVGWLVLATSGSSFWSKWDLDRCFLVGWLLGCSAVTLSGPFYPYPDRGTMTLQVPLYILAGMIYFSRRERVSPAAVLVVIALSAVTPLWAIQHEWRYAGFTTDEPHKFTSVEHEMLRATLVRAASRNDILVADEYELLWLAPEYPGRHYCGHFFLTAHYAERRREVARFFDGSPSDQAQFLASKRVRFVYVAARQSPARFASVPGLRVVRATAAGSLFEYAP